MDFLGNAAERDSSVSSEQTSPQPDLNSPREPMRRVEIVISNLLRAGVLISLALILVGSVVFFSQHPGYITSRDELSALIQPARPASHPLRAMIAGLREAHGESIALLGLLVLIATPMMRVAVSVIAFLKLRDRAYMLITLTVFCLLLLSLVLGKIE
jgi:uncharacterized membrane protein